MGQATATDRTHLCVNLEAWMVTRRSGDFRSTNRRRAELCATGDRESGAIRRSDVVQSRPAHSSPACAISLELVVALYGWALTPGGLVSADHMTEMPWRHIAKLTGKGAALLFAGLSAWAFVVVRHDLTELAESQRPPRWTDENRFDTRPRR